MPGIPEVLDCFRIAGYTYGYPTLDHPNDENLSLGTPKPQNCKKRVLRLAALAQDDSGENGAPGERWTGGSLARVRALERWQPGEGEEKCSRSLKSRAGCR